MISFISATKEYRLDEQNTITPVNNLNLEIEKGEFIMVTGRSGSGKTTLLNLAAGLIKITSGQVLIDNGDLSKLNDRDLSILRSRKLGFVFQFPSLLPSLTVLENVALPRTFISQANGKIDSDPFLEAAELLKTVGLEKKQDVYPRQLSAGEQKRVVIVRSLINHPSVILADEPTSDLDEQTEGEIMELLKKINQQGVTFLMVTHSLHLTGFADRAFEMINNSLLPFRGRKTC
jgi:ABC-type lipoprotein export system ATPase subunit